MYRLDRIPERAFDLARSKGYSFFFESLFVLHLNGFKIREIPIRLPARACGQSKMRVSDAWIGLKMLMATVVRRFTDPSSFRL